jgi:hypothetical protein
MTEINRQNWKQILDEDGMPSLYVPVALGEDFDGCFGNTDEAMRIVEHIAAENTHLTVTEIREARSEVEAKLMPFSTVEFINRELDRAGEGKTWSDDMRPHILERAAESHHRERLLTRGAAAVFAVARELGMPEIIVTHGAVAHPGGASQEWAAVEWQTVKVKMTPKLQDKPLVVTHSVSKGEEFRSWYDTRLKAFKLPKDAWLDEHEPLYAGAIIHVDDKRSALRNWPSDLPLYAIQYLPENDDEVREAQIRGELPRGVPIARGMGQVAHLLAELYQRAV